MYVIITFQFMKSRTIFDTVRRAAIAVVVRITIIVLKNLKKNYLFF